MARRPTAHAVGRDERRPPARARRVRRHRPRRAPFPHTCRSGGSARVGCEAPSCPRASTSRRSAGSTSAHVRAARDALAVRDSSSEAEPEFDVDDTAWPSTWDGEFRRAPDGSGHATRSGPSATASIGGRERPSRNVAGPGRRRVVEHALDGGGEEAERSAGVVAGDVAEHAVERGTRACARSASVSCSSPPAPG